MPPIDVIGLGIDAGSLSPERERLVMRASLLAGGRRHLARFPDAPGERLVIAAPLSACLDALEAAHRAGRTVAVLCSGDALFFGLGRTLAARFAAGELVFHPGPTAMQTAAARLGLPYEDLAVVSLHGRGDFSPVFSALARGKSVFVYTDPQNGPAAVAAALAGRGAGAAMLSVCEDLGGPGEKITRLTPAQAMTISFAEPNCLLVTPPPESPTPRAMGLGDESYRHQAGLISKWPVRAAALAALRVFPEALVWDLGAGCGAVAIEASRLAHGGRVLAVEKDPGRLEMIRENVAAHQAFAVEPVPGLMPGCLDTLPEPDRIFIGGGLSGGPRVLERAAALLKPGGRLVVAAVLLASLETARALLHGLGWTAELTLIQAGLGAPLAGDMRLTAVNPVFLLAADKPREQG